MISLKILSGLILSSILEFFNIDLKTRGFE